MRSIPTSIAASAFLASLLLAATAQAQDRSDWQSLAQLHPGDNVRLTIKSGSSEGVFQSWTPQQVTVGAVTAKKEDVVKIELHSRGRGLGRSKKALIGALIGFGGGFGIGAAVRGNCQPGHSIGPCPTRGELGALAGGVGAVIGAVIGAALPPGGWREIYRIRIVASNTGGDITR
jgi:hypothetical protein